MDCSTAREALSATLDGEPLDIELAALEAHLDDCADCRRWREHAHELTRRFRLSAAPGAPRPDSALVAAARAAAPRRRRLGPVQLVRLALLLVGVEQVILAVQTSILGSDHDAPLHVAHETASFELAIAAGFLMAALRPSRARGIGVVVGAAALLLVATALLDIAAGRTSAAGELPHLLVVAGWLLLRRLGAITASDGEDPALRLESSAARWTAAVVALPGTARSEEPARPQEASSLTMGTRGAASAVHAERSALPNEPLDRRALAS
jgi:predicted anti-sigma-YlaC factor YlaD